MPGLNPKLDSTITAAVHGISVCCWVQYEEHMLLELLKAGHPHAAQKVGPLISLMSGLPVFAWSLPRPQVPLPLPRNQSCSCFTWLPPYHTASLVAPESQGKHALELIRGASEPHLCHMAASQAGRCKPEPETQPVLAIVLGLPEVWHVPRVSTEP